MSDRLHQTATIDHDDVNPDAVRDKVADVLLLLEGGAERRSLALDWNSLEICVRLHLNQSDLFIDAQVDVLS